MKKLIAAVLLAVMVTLSPAVFGVVFDADTVPAAQAGKAQSGTGET